MKLKNITYNMKSVYKCSNPFVSLCISNEKGRSNFCLSQQLKMSASLARREGSSVKVFTM